MHSTLTTAGLPDGRLHPHAGGYDKMAVTWFGARQSVPGSIGDPAAGQSGPAT